MRHSSGCFVLVVLALAAAPARAEDPVELARRTVERHRSSEHRAKFDVVLPREAPLPREGEVRIEARGGRFVRDETGLSLEVRGGVARLTLVSWAHLPVFAARASNRRDGWRLLEATLEPARARELIAAVAVLAAGRILPKGSAGLEPGETATDEEGGDAEWPRATVVLDGRRGSRRGSFAELARLLLDEVGKEAGLAPPLDPVASARRLAGRLSSGGAEAARAAFVLGELGAIETLPLLEKSDEPEAREARAKLDALASKDPRAQLLHLALHHDAWDVRAWARERLAQSYPDGRAGWVARALDEKDVGEDALVEALSALTRDEATARAPRLEPLVEKGSPAVRVEAAAALLRAGPWPPARAALVAVARDPDASADARETALARIASALPPDEAAAVLGDIVTDAGAPTTVRAQAARAAEQAGAVASIPALARGLELLASGGRGEEERDLVVALVSSLDAVATMTSAGDAANDAKRALLVAARSERDEELRALAIHAAGSLGVGLDEVLEQEKKREPTAERALRAAELEKDARGSGEAKLRALADSACEAPLRSVLERLVREGRDPGVKRDLIARLRARGALGEAGLEVLGR